MLRRLASASCLLPVCALAQPAAAQAVRGTSSLTIGSIGAGCIFGGALLGMALGKIVPAHHLSEDSKDAIKLGAGMISLMAALVLGLLVSSAKSNFDAANAAVTQGGARAILLDRVLAHYGAEAEEVRQDLREAVAITIETLWPQDHPMASGLDERFCSSG